MKWTPITLALALLNGCSSTQNGVAPEAGAESGPEATVNAEAEKLPVLLDTFADIQILRYEIPGFDELSPKQKEMLYYLYEAARAGRDILYDQHYEHNLLVRDVIEAIVRSYEGERSTPAWASFMTYVKAFWFASGIHHHYSSQKLVPGFTADDFAMFVRGSDAALLPPDASGDGAKGAGLADAVIAKVTPILFDPAVAPVGVNRDPSADLVADSANNFYSGLTQKEVEAFYGKKIDADDPEAPSWGLNSQLVKEKGKIVERPWKVGGMYGPAIEQIVGWLKKASAVAENDKQKTALDLLIEFYETGDLKKFDAYNVAWVQDTDSRIDVVNGFIETYGDALGYRATWESVVSIRDLERTKRIETIGGAAAWFEANSPIAEQHKKKDVVGISAKVITVVAEGGDCAPMTPVGINLPNADWIRKKHGSKSVFLGNIVDANLAVLAFSGVLEEFTFSDEELQRAKNFEGLGYSLKVDMHEVIGHASGQLEPGVKSPNETLKAYDSALEEARADLVALYFLPDPKLQKIGVVPSPEVAKAGYDGYIRSGLLVQLARIKPGADIAQSHMRNRQMVSLWAYEKGKADNVIEKVQRDGKTYFVIRDYAKLRDLWGQLLREVQRIKSTGDYEAGKALIETYGVKVDRAVHDDVLARYAKLDKARPYAGFVQPKLVPVREGDAIVDVRVEYPGDFAQQMLEYSEQYGFLRSR